MQFKTRLSNLKHKKGDPGKMIHHAVNNLLEVCILVILNISPYLILMYLDNSL